MESTHLPAAARHFDDLADSVQFDIADVIAVTRKSRATIYRWIAAGQFPRPHKNGNSQNLWSVGDIRRALAGN